MCGMTFLLFGNLVWAEVSNDDAKTEEFLKQEEQYLRDIKLLNLRVQKQELELKEKKMIQKLRGKQKDQKFNELIPMSAKDETVVEEIVLQATIMLPEDQYAIFRKGNQELSLRVQDKLPNGETIRQIEMERVIVRNDKNLEKTYNLVK